MKRTWLDLLALADLVPDDKPLCLRKELRDYAEAWNREVCKHRGVEHAVRHSLRRIEAALADLDELENKS